MVRMSLLYQFLGYSPENQQNKLSAAQYELLMCLTKQQVDQNMSQAWTPIVGSLEQNIASFISEGLVEEASIEEKFDAKYRVADLKTLLERHSIPAKGRKNELIARYLDSIPLTTAANDVAGVRLYHATGKGKKSIDSYLNQKEMDRKMMEASAMAYLTNGDITRAGQRIALYESQQVFHRGTAIDWTKGMPESYQKIAAYLIAYNYDELPLMESQRKEVGAKLALSVLLGESHDEAGRRILEVANCDLDDPYEIAKLYATTRINEASTNVDLETLSAYRLGKGIRILPANNDNCVSCTRGKHQYLWSEIQNLPRLPKQWGCQCTYSAWI